MKSAFQLFKNTYKDRCYIVHGIDTYTEMQQYLLCASCIFMLFPQLKIHSHKDIQWALHLGKYGHIFLHFYDFLPWLQESGFSLEIVFSLVLKFKFQLGFQPWSRDKDLFNSLTKAPSSSYTGNLATFYMTKPCLSTCPQISLEINPWGAFVRFKHTYVTPGVLYFGMSALIPMGRLHSHCDLCLHLTWENFQRWDTAFVSWV